MKVVDPGLQTLFVLLRGAGITVGLEELRRLGAVFAAAPELDEDGLRLVVETVVVKSLEQQAAFRHLYDKWLATVEQQIARAEVRAEHQRLTGMGVPEGAIPAERSRSERVPVPMFKDRSRPVPAPAIMRPPEEFTGPIDPPPGTAAGSSPGAAPGPAGRSGAPGAARAGMVHPLAPASMQPWLHTDTGKAVVTISPGRVPRQAGVRVMRWTAILAGLAAIVLVVWRIMLPSYVPTTLDRIATGNGGEVGHSIAMAGKAARTVYLPELYPVWPEGPPFNYPGYGLLALALAAGAWLWLRRGRGRWLPEVGRTHGAPGAAVVTHAAPTGTAVGALFLDARDEENLVWGVGRFASEDLGRDLDVQRSVRDTAAAYGRPVLRYESARYQREVWLWVDESLDSPAARHLARDLTRTLESSGLPVVKSTFWGIPYQLATEGDESLSVDELDARRDTAVVAVLTDGRLMHAAHRARDRGDDVRALLRNLSFWPRVTFIAFGHDRGRLAAMIEPHGMRVIQPQDAPAAISDLAGGGERGGYERLVGDARVWAAACALSPRPVDDPTALTLRRMLGLEVSPWAIETLRQSADSNAGGLSWATASRASLLSWLLDAEDLPARGAPPPASLLARIVSAWDRLLDERERAQRRSPDWVAGCQAETLLCMERAFLHLWDDPDEAAANLYELFYDSRLRPIIRYHLAQLAPREGADDVQSIPLPWSLSDRRRETQVMLAEMGFGRRAGLGGRRSLPPPGRLLLALALCVGAFLGAAGSILEERLTRQPHQPEMVNRWPGRKLPFVSSAPVDRYTWQVRAWTPWSEEPVEVEVKAEWDYVLRGQAKQLLCSEIIEGMEVRRCCPEGASNPPFPDRWSMAVLRPHEFASDVANELLCSGSVDAAYLLDADAPYPDWSVWGHDPANSQLLVVADEVPELLGQYPGSVAVVSLDDLGALLTVANFGNPGDRATLAARRPRLETLAGHAQGFLVQGVGPCGDEGQRCCAPPERDDLFVCRKQLACVDGVCVPQACVPGEARCEGSAVKRCNDLGTGEETLPCQEGEICLDGACTVPEAGRECKPGRLRCNDDGTQVLVCNGTGTWAFHDDCPGDSLCKAGMCRPITVAAVTFDPLLLPAAVPEQRTILTCTVGDRTVRWPGQDMQHQRKVRLRFEPDMPLQVHCELRTRQGVMDRAERVHAWNLASQGKHTLAFEELPDLRVTYEIELVLAPKERRDAQ